MGKNVVIDGVRWIETPIDMAIQYADVFEYRICVYLNSDKHIVIDYDSTQTQERLVKLREKSVTSIFLAEADLMLFMVDVKSHLEKATQTPTQLKASEVFGEACSVNTCFEFMKMSFVNLGFSSESLALAENINKRSMRMVRGCNNLVDMLRRLRNELHPQFMEALLTGSMSVCLAESFSWASEEIKEKLSLGAMLCQLNWDKADHEKYKARDYTLELKKRPLEMADSLREAKIFPREVIEIVEQAFEKPDGSGFPKGMTAASMSRLAAIHIVSHAFIQKLIASEFNYSQRLTIVSELKETYKEGAYKNVIDVVAKRLAA